MLQFERNGALALFKDQDAGLPSDSALVNYYASSQPVGTNNAHIAMPMSGGYFLPGLSEPLQVREHVGLVQTGCWSNHDGYDCLRQ